jgi:hypothetical protein
VSTAASVEKEDTDSKAAAQISLMCLTEHSMAVDMMSDMLDSPLLTRLPNIMRNLCHNFFIK